MRKLTGAFLLSVGLAVAEESFTVEKLTECEVKELAVAREGVEKAKAALEKVEGKLKRDHGGPTGLYFTGCYYKDVEFRGEYALISEKSVCSTALSTGSLTSDGSTTLTWNGSTWNVGEGGTLAKQPEKPKRTTK